MTTYYPGVDAAADARTSPSATCCRCRRASTGSRTTTRLASSESDIIQMVSSETDQLALRRGPAGAARARHGVQLLERRHDAAVRRDRAGDRHDRRASTPRRSCSSRSASTRSSGGATPRATRSPTAASTRRAATSPASGCSTCNGGAWGDEQVVPAGVGRGVARAGADVSRGTATSGGSPATRDGSCPTTSSRPAGHDGQYIYVIPSLDLVVVRNGTYVKYDGEPVADPNLFGTYPSDGLVPGAGHEPARDGLGRRRVPQPDRRVAALRLTSGRSQTRYSTAVKPPRPEGSRSASASDDAAAHAQRSEVGLRRVPRPSSGVPRRRGRRCPTAGGTAPACGPTSAGGSWSRATSVVMSHEPGIGEVVPGALVAAVRAQPVAPRQPGQLGGRRPAVVEHVHRPGRRAAHASPPPCSCARPLQRSPRSVGGRPAAARTGSGSNGALSTSAKRSAPSSMTNASRHPPSNTARRNGTLSSTSLAMTTPVSDARTGDVVERPDRADVRRMALTLTSRDLDGRVLERR